MYSAKPPQSWRDIDMLIASLKDGLLSELGNDIEEEVKDPFDEPE